MKHWWEIATAQAPEAPKLRAVAYYRHSAQDRHSVAHPVMWRSSFLRRTFQRFASFLRHITVVLHSGLHFLKIARN